MVVSLDLLQCMLPNLLQRKPPPQPQLANAESCLRRQPNVIVAVRAMQFTPVCGANMECSSSQAKKMCWLIPVTKPLAFGQV